MSYKADLYIMIPCKMIQDKEKFIKENKHDDNDLFIKELGEYQMRKQGEMFISELSEVAEYEFRYGFNKRINRNYLRNITLICETDKRRNNVVKRNQDAFITISQFENTEICLFTIGIVDIKVSLITYILDQVSREELFIPNAGKEKTLHNWMKDDLKFEPTGKAFFASCMTKLPNTKEARYIISAEANSRDNKYSIISKATKTFLNNNFALYSNYDAYMSECGIIYVMKNMKKIKIIIKIV